MLSLIISIIGIIIIIKTLKSVEEEMLWLKIIGYHILGTIVFTLIIPIPLGLILHFLLLKPKFNREAKTAAVIFGLVMAFIG